MDDSAGEVRFSSGDHRTEITATCVAGQPHFTVEEDDRRGDAGGNSGRGGGDDG